MIYEKTLQCKCCDKEFICKLCICPKIQKGELLIYSNNKFKNEVILDEKNILDTFTNDDNKKVYKIYGNCPYCYEEFNDEIIEE